MAQYPPFTTAGTVPAGGTLTLAYRTRGNQTTRVTQVTAEMPTVGNSSAAGAICTLRLNGNLISPLVPTGDAASGDPPIWVGPGDELTVTWSAAPAGLVGRIAVLYDLGLGT